MNGKDQAKPQQEDSKPIDGQIEKDEEESKHGFMIEKDQEKSKTGDSEGMDEKVVEDQENSKQGDPKAIQDQISKDQEKSKKGDPEAINDDKENYEEKQRVMEDQREEDKLYEGEDKIIDDEIVTMMEKSGKAYDPEIVVCMRKRYKEYVGAKLLKKAQDSPAGTSNVTPMQELENNEPVPGADSESETQIDPPLLDSGVGLEKPNTGDNN